MLRSFLAKKNSSGNYSDEVQSHAKSTTELPEDVGGPLMKYAINIDEAPDNDLEQLEVESRRAKKGHKDDDINQNDKKESRTTRHNTDSQRQEHQHSQKENTEKKHSEKINKRDHKDKNKEHTQKNIDREKDSSTRLSYRGKNKERKNDDIHKKNITVDKPKNKHRKKTEQAVDKSKDDIRMAKVGAAALQGQPLTSNKDLKAKSGTISKQVLESTSTQKPQPIPVREEVVDKTMSKLKLRSHKNNNGEKIRGILRHSGEGGEGAEYKGHEYGGGHTRIGGDVSRKKRRNKEDKYPSYLSPYAIKAQIEELMKEFPNANATVLKFARTVEYNDLVLITVTDKKENERQFRARDTKYIDDAPEKKIIFIVHGLTVMGMKSLTSLVVISELKLLFSYYFKHLDKFDFYIMPLANPDGYSASRTSDRTIWNKNVSPQSECPGVYVDRNFDVAWNSKREISSCSQIYPGPKPFSEVESKAVRDVFHYFSHKILAYIHVHSGTFDEKVFKGDAILYPRGYTETQSDDDKYIDLKGEVDEAMKNASFRVISVTVDTLANWYGVVTGTSVDYAASVFGIPYALEFVMQVYDTETLNNYALTQIWSRLIDTTLSNMWKSLRHASEERTLH